MKEINIKKKSTGIRGNSFINKIKNNDNIFSSSSSLNKINNQFQKYSNESEYTTKMQSTKNSKTLEFPTIQCFQQSSSYNNNNLFNPKDEKTFSDEYYLKLFLLNSISFDDYQKAIIELKQKKMGLPPINNEDRKDDKNTSDAILNDLFIPGSIKQKKRTRINYNNKYTSCLDTLSKINNYKKINCTILGEGMNNKYNGKVCDISKNHLLREIILNEYCGKDFNYEQQKLFRNYKHYNNWIKKQLLELKKEIPPEEKVHRTFEKEYKHSNYNNPILYLNSLSISFYCKGKSHYFHIPFEYLPLFYYKNMSHLKLILISLFKFQNNFEDIMIDYDEIIYILSCCKQFEIKPEEIIDEKEINIINDSNNSQMNNITLSNNINFDKRISCQTPNNQMSLNESPKSRDTHKKKNTTNYYHKKDTKNKKAKKTEEKKEIDIEEGNLYKCIYNKFVFKWITPKYNYDITVKSPEAIFQIGRTVLKAYIDIELIFYLLENNFTNWDYFISQYIFSYKECHKKMNKLTSVKSMKNIFPNVLNSFSVKNNEKIKDKYIKKKNLNYLNDEKIQQISDKSKTFEFLYTDKSNNNYLKVLHSFFITSRCRAFNKNKFCFDFNFFYMKILNKVLRIQGLNHFLKKLIIIDKDTLSLHFRYDKLSTLANGEYKVLENYEPNIKGEQTCLRMKERNKDIINFTISFPVLETIKYNNLNYENCFESDYDEIIFDGISLDTLDELCRNDYKEWPCILMK